MSEQLRNYAAYPAYKPSGVPWLGDIPAHWEMWRAKFLFKKLERPVRDTDEVVTAFRDGQVTLRKNRRTLGFTFSIKEIGYQGVRKGDLVIHGMDGFAGAIGVSDSDGKCSPVYSVCVPITELDVYYYAYLLRHMALSGFIRALAKGIRERSTEFRFDVFKELLLPVFPYAEQRAIARFLDRETGRIDVLIARKQRLIELLREKRAALITSAVTRGLNPHAPLRESGVPWLGKIPGHWEVVRLKFLTSKIGSGKTPSGGSKVYQDSGVLFIRSQNVHFDGLRLDDAVYISKEIDAEMSSTRVLPNDILLNITGASLGRASLVPNWIPLANVNQHVSIIRPKPNRIVPRFLHAVISSDVIQNQIFSTENGAAREGLPFSQIANLILALPPLPEQRAIADYLDRETARIDALIQKIEASIETWKEYRTALITAAVTGKIDVREKGSR